MQRLEGELNIARQHIGFLQGLVAKLHSAALGFHSTSPNHGAVFPFHQVLPHVQQPMPPSQHQVILARSHTVQLPLAATAPTLTSPSTNLPPSFYD